VLCTISCARLYDSDLNLGYIYRSFANFARGLARTPSVLIPIYKRLYGQGRNAADSMTHHHYSLRIPKRVNAALDLAERWKREAIKDVPGVLQEDGLPFSVMEKTGRIKRSG